MKRNILITFTGAMELGGIERSLIGLLDAIDCDCFDVDLFLYGHHGLLFTQINSHVDILPEVKELAYLRESFSTKLRHGCFYSAAMRVRDGMKSYFTHVNHDITWAQIMRKCAPELNKHYDLALGFFRPFDFIVEKVDADIKVGWVHTDYTKAGEDIELLFKDYSRMDYIAAVSEDCAASFQTLFPELADRVRVIENVLSPEAILKEADAIDVSQEMPDDGTIKLLSIGRFCYPKNFDNVPAICKLLQAQGLNVRWYLIGFGSDETLIRQKIAEAGAEKDVVILGKKENPYPYIKACNLYVQPSRYEGKAVTVREAQMLHKPVVITNYATSGSQLRDGYDGVVVPMDNEGCAAGVAAVIRDAELRQRLEENTRKEDYSNAGEIEKLYRLMDIS